MKGVATFVIAASVALFQVAQEPLLPTSDSRFSLEYGCDPVRLPNGDLAIQQGVAAQGGDIRFNFKSVRGSNCRDYILWNTPGQQSVKVKWQYSGDRSQPILAETTLAKCPVGSECVPVHFPNNEPSLLDLRGTTLGYGGANADTHTDHPRAYVSDRDESTETPTRSIIEGTVGDREGRPVEIAVEVTSAVVGKTPPYNLVYTIRTVAKSRPFSLWLADRKPDPSELVVRWEAVESSEFFAILRKEGYRLSGDRRVNIEIPVKAFERSSKLLVVMQGDDRLAAVSAAAYVASK